jgi:hypothetical protein
MYTTAKKRTFLCSTCDKAYGSCEHTDNHQTLPKEESGNIISNMEFLVLVENGDI